MQRDKEKKVSLQHILRPGRKGVGEVLQEVKVWNDGFTVAKLERVFTKLKQFVDQFEQNKPSGRDAAIVFLAYCELFKEMIVTMEKTDESFKQDEKDRDFSEFDWLNLLCRTFKLIHIEEVGADSWSASSKPSSSQSQSNYQSASSSQAAAGIGIREKDISRMQQSLDSLRKYKIYFGGAHYPEEQFNSMIAPITRLMEKARKVKGDAIDQGVFREANPADEQDYLYYKTGYVISALATSLRYPKEVEQSAFDILHRVSFGLQLRANEVTVAGLTALHLSSKCWSDTFRTAGLRELISKGVLHPQLNSSPCFRIPSRAPDKHPLPEGSDRNEESLAAAMTAQHELFVADVRKRCVAFEVNCLAAIEYGFHFEEACLLRKGGVIEKTSRALKVPETDTQLARGVIADASFKFSHLCLMHNKTLLAIAAISIVRIPKSQRIANAVIVSADDLLNREEVGSMSAQKNLDPALVYKVANLIYRYRAEIVPAMEERLRKEDAHRLEKGEWLEVDQDTEAPASASAPSLELAPQLTIPSPGKLTRANSLITGPSLPPPPSLVPPAPLSAKLQHGQKRGREGPHSTEPTEGRDAAFHESINQLHANLLEAKAKIGDDKGGKAAKQYLHSRKEVIRRWGFVPEALPQTRKPDKAKVSRMWSKIVSWQNNLQASTDTAMQAKIAIACDELRAWGVEPPLERNGHSSGSGNDNENCRGAMSNRGNKAAGGGDAKRPRDGGILSRLGGEQTSGERGGGFKKARRGR